jgi:hypothetical protein
VQVVRLYRNFAPLAGGHAHGDLAADVGDLALQLANARLAGVLLDDPGDGLIGELDVIGGDPMGLELFGNQVALGDLQLLLDDLPG